MESLTPLLKLAGIQPVYEDIWGKEHGISRRTARLLLDALGLPSDTPDDIATSIKRLEAERNRPLPDSIVLPENRAQIIHCDLQGEWQLACEDGQDHRGQLKDGQIHLPPLPMGYHTLRVGDMECMLIIAPPKCWLPEEMAEGSRVWGLAAQLYGIRSGKNWGIGDYGDLAQLAANAARTGADVIGLNPLHAMFPENPQRFSPYAPSSRLWLNALYLDVTAIDGFESEAVQTLLDDGFRQKLEQARQAELVDYPLVASLKRPVLEALFTHQQNNNQSQALNDFAEKGGDLLYQQALFAALSEHFAKEPKPRWNWQEWPSAYRTPNTKEVAQFARDHQTRIRFFQWLQFEADRQLANAQQTARDAGMRLGLYRDLAVGPDTAGAENWMDPARFVHGVSIGAPPDEYNLKGQNWGLPPLNPLKLRRRRFAPFIELVRANMRHAKALRIDHAFALSRIYWVPQGKSAADGAYVSYPFEAMLGILRVESHRQCCIVIGEDLGTFPPGYKEKAAESGLFSYKVLYFERDQEGEFLPPVDYPARALATVSTHDLPTFAGWMAATDIDLRTRLGLYPTRKYERHDRSGREKDQVRLMRALQSEGLTQEPAQAAQYYLARTPAFITVTQLEDLLGLVEQANLPGTTDEHPNWRRRLPVTLGELFHDSPLNQQARQIAKERAGRDYPPLLSTYRLQFHSGFTFNDAIDILPYLKTLGISHVYASPVFTARPGSNHGYDVLDPTRINPELGGEEGFSRFADALLQNGLYLLLDFVPNHMAADWRNPWWWSVLKEGRQSPYAAFFDIDWDAAEGKTILPVLGGTLEEVLEKDELAVKEDNGEPYLAYYEHRFPLNPERPPKKTASIRRLLQRQHYQLVDWRESATRINYRRFFEINGLVSLRMEDPSVFRAVHHRLFEMVRAGRLHGLRIDHIDGLADPDAYLHRLEERLGRDFPIIVEKVLGEDEQLPSDWPVAGTTGYEAMNQLAALFVPPKSEAEMTALYGEFTGEAVDFSRVLQTAKQQVLNESFGSELTALTRLLDTLVPERWPQAQLREALEALIVSFPVYRSYVTPQELNPQDARWIAEAVKGAKTMQPNLPEALLDFIGQLLQLAFAPTNEAQRHFTTRFQKLTGPVMAKGMEDTAFYRYWRLAALNEVGGEPGHFGHEVADFHRFCQNRPPQALTATATHDHKRGEDTRLRMALLAQKPDAWAEAVQRWHAMNHSLAQGIHPADEYLLYQTLVGSWPDADMNADDDYAQRLQDYMIKALREGKQRSHWLAPDEVYERRMGGFIARLIKRKPFIAAFKPFWQAIAQSAKYAGLVQTALKLTMPGVPDIYQGCEFNDLSLVDPDNRRPVDYAARMDALQSKDNLKQRLIQTLLQHRRQNPQLYRLGDYHPLSMPEGVLAFRRSHSGQQLFVAVQLRDWNAPPELPDAISTGHWQDVLDEDWAELPLRIWKRTV